MTRILETTVVVSVVTSTLQMAVMKPAFASVMRWGGVLKKMRSARTSKNQVCKWQCLVGQHRKRRLGLKVASRHACRGLQQTKSASDRKRWQSCVISCVDTAFRII